MKLFKNNILILPLLITALTLPLTSCGTVQVVDTCPTNPKLTAREPLGKAFQVRMDDFLSGKLPAQTGLESPLKPVINTPTP